MSVGLWWLADVQESVGGATAYFLFHPLRVFGFCRFVLASLVALSPLARRPACASSSVPEHLPEFLRFLSTPDVPGFLSNPSINHFIEQIPPDSGVVNSVPPLMLAPRR